MAEVTFNPGAPASTSTYTDASSNYLNQMIDNYINGKPIFTIPEFPANYKPVSTQKYIDNSLNKSLYEPPSVGKSTEAPATIERGTYSNQSFTVSGFSSPANYRHVSFQECLDKSIKKPLYDSESWGDKFQKASEQNK